MHPFSLVQHLFICLIFTCTFFSSIALVYLSDLHVHPFSLIQPLFICLIFTCTLFLWYSPCLSVWSSRAPSIKTAPLFVCSRALQIPHVKTQTFRQRSFSDAPIWNSMPREIRHTFKPLLLKQPWRAFLFTANSCHQSTLFGKVISVDPFGACVRECVRACERECVCVCFISRRYTLC